MSTGARVLFLTPVPTQGAGCRYRIQQYLPYLSAHGVEGAVAPFYSPEFFRIVYARRAYGRKAAFFFQSTLRRLSELAKAARFDAVFVYREAFPLGPPWIEWLVARVFRRPLVFDFDDAIFLPDTNEANRFLSFAKYPRKVPSVLRWSAEVIAGNGYLAAYARRHNPQVTVLPTVVDTSRYVPRAPVADRASSTREVVVGWIGSQTTSRYLPIVSEALERLSNPSAFVFKVVGAGRDIRLRNVRVDNRVWRLDRETEEFRSCDIGVYPLCNDEWSRGKCGFKAIQFMAGGVPVVASAVGCSVEIIEDGVNGYLVSSPEEWRERLERLIGDPELRLAMGRRGRRTAEDSYSLDVAAPKFLGVLQRALNGRTDTELDSATAQRPQRMKR